MCLIVWVIGGVEVLEGKVTGVVVKVVEHGIVYKDGALPGLTRVVSIVVVVLEVDSFGSLL